MQYLAIRDFTIASNINMLSDLRLIVVSTKSKNFVYSTILY